ncbi:MAG TPA: class I SAM-dependent methyltransferase [Bryobacteraceae bacterium]|nr:class I SAM-dependent methyltransferase [Bryobacteraceae bacterium]
MLSGPTPVAQGYWDAAADTYDQVFTNTLVGQTRREAVWRDLERVFQPRQRVLELNCGTGLDALHLAQRGVQVLACDISPRMVELARDRVAAAKLNVDFRVLANEDLAQLATDGPFDGAFSNFSGLNCVDDLAAAARDLGSLLKPGSTALLCMVGRFVPWDFIWFLAHGNPGRAMQRIRGGASRALDGGTLRVQYPTVRELRRLFAPWFRLRKWRGIGIGVPPSYMAHWTSRFPRTTRTLAAIDIPLGRTPMVRNMADCVLLHFERTDAAIR